MEWPEGPSWRLRGPLVLSDTGEGMTDDVIARAFDPFFTTKSAGKGSGMGLAQAYGFARQAGGALSLQSQPGHGTTAMQHLPRSMADSGSQPDDPNEAAAHG